MTKAELVTEVAAKSGLSKKDTEKAIAGVIETITETLAKEESIQLVGFGTFEVREHAARTGINPRTKEKIEIAAKKVIKFKAGAELANEVK